MGCSRMRLTTSLGLYHTQHCEKVMDLSRDNFYVTYTLGFSELMLALTSSCCTIFLLLIISALSCDILISVVSKI